MMLSAVLMRAGTRYAVGIVLYNERSHYRRLRVENVAVDSYVHAAFDSSTFSDQLQPFDLFLTGQLTASACSVKWISGRIAVAFTHTLAKSRKIRKLSVVYICMPFITKIHADWYHKVICVK